MQGDEGRGGVADGENAGFGELCRPLHGDNGPGDAPLLGFLRHIRVGHEAVHLPPQLTKNRFVDARAGHLGIGDDIAAAAQGFDALGNRVLGKDQILHIVKIRRGVDDPLDDQLVFRVQFGVPQQLRDDGEAALFDVHGFDVFNHGDVSP